MISLKLIIKITIGNKERVNGNETLKLFAKNILAENRFNTNTVFLNLYSSYSKT